MVIITIFEKANSDQRLEGAALKHWSKYTTNTGKNGMNALTNRLFEQKEKIELTWLILRK